MENKKKLRAICAIFLFLIIFQTKASWTNAPVLIRISDAVKPSKVFTINGEGLDSGLVTIAMAQDLTGASPLTPTNGWTSAGIVQYDNKGNFVVVRFPSSLPAGIYNVWVQNSFGWSKPIKLNAPRSQFISEKEAWAGLEIEVVGRNFDGFEFGATTNTQIRLNNGSNTYSQTIVTLNPYNAKFKITSATPTGTYNVEASNDGGIHWSKPSSEQILTILPIGRDDYNLGVAWANDFNYDTIYNVVNNGVPVNSPNDVSWPVQIVINLVKSKGGGVVYFPNGTYKINQIQIPANVILKGQSATNTKLLSLGNNMIIPMGDGRTVGLFGIYNIGFGSAVPTSSLGGMFVNTNYFPPGPVSPKNTSRIFMKKVNIDYPLTYTTTMPPQGGAFTIVDKERLLVADCKIKGFMANVNFWAAQYVQCKNNYIASSRGAVIMSTARYSFIENDSVIGQYPNNHPNNAGISARDQCYFSNNYVQDIGSGNNDGEGLMVESNTADINYGFVTNATSSSLVGVAQSTTNPLVTPTVQSFYYDGLNVMIIHGRGLGQYRKVLSVNNGTIIIDKPWDVIPDSTSKWSMFMANKNITWYNNTIKNCGAGYVLFGNWVDGVVADNLSINSIGVTIYSVARNDNFSASYFLRIARNNIMGVSWAVKFGAISACPARWNTNFNNNFAGTQIYGTEIKENYVFGDPSQNPSQGYTAPPTKANIALCEHTGTNFFNGYYNGSLINRDLLNSTVEDNILKNAKYGIEITKGNYGVVECNNSFQNITVSNYTILPAVLPVVQNFCSVGITTDINKANLANNSFVVMPNPTNGVIDVQTSNELFLINKISIINLMGQEVFIRSDFYEAKKATLNIENIAAGVYFINIETTNKTKETVKLIKY